MGGTTDIQQRDFFFPLQRTFCFFASFLPFLHPGALEAMVWVWVWAGFLRGGSRKTTPPAVGGVPFVLLLSSQACKRTWGALYRVHCPPPGARQAHPPRQEGPEAGASEGARKGGADGPGVRAGCLRTGTGAGGKKSAGPHGAEGGGRVWSPTLAPPVPGPAGPFPSTRPGN